MPSPSPSPASRGCRLASLDGDPSAALALFDRALLLAGLLDLSGGLGLLPGDGRTP
jgi:hypothetical protein